MVSLRSLSTDGTYDQMKQFNRLRLLSKGKNTYCFDLSKATHRFPIQLQRVLLSELVNENFAKS